MRHLSIDHLRSFGAYPEMRIVGREAGGKGDVVWSWTSNSGIPPPTVVRVFRGALLPFKRTLRCPFERVGPQDCVLLERWRRQRQCSIGCPTSHRGDVMGAERR